MLSPDSHLVLSFRHLLVDAVSKLLESMEWYDEGLPDSFVELLTGLAKHREEGKRLVPAVFVTRDLEKLMIELGGSSAISLGSGPVHPTTIGRALKHCAPLGEGRSWVIYLKLEKEKISYGVFRAPTSPIEPTAFERLRRSAVETPTSLGVVQLADNILEIRGSASFYRYIHLSGAHPTSIQPMQVVRDFIKALVSDMPTNASEPMSRLYYRLLMDVMQTWHGMLAVVVKDQNSARQIFEDGVYLDPPLDIGGCVKRFVGDTCYDAGSELQARLNLIRGMLGSDGILVFTSDGKLIAFNVFVRHDGELTLPFQPLGGARRRTFEYLKPLVGKEIIAAFYRSQDGFANCASSLR